MRTKPTADFEMSAKRRIALTNDVKLRHAKPFQDRSLQNKEHTIENEKGKMLHGLEPVLW